MSSLGTASAQAIALINHIREVGGDIDLDLPRIVFAGIYQRSLKFLPNCLRGETNAQAAIATAIKAARCMHPKWLTKMKMMLSKNSYNSVHR